MKKEINTKTNKQDALNKAVQDKLKNVPQEKGLEIVPIEFAGLLAAMSAASGAATGPVSIANMLYQNYKANSSYRQAAERVKNGTDKFNLEKRIPFGKEKPAKWAIAIDAINPFFKKGGDIHIKKKNKGKFTDYCGGKVTDECIAKASGNKKLIKRATFAEMLENGNINKNKSLNL